ncbi:LysR family transcriptional regulator [Leifsonia sp. Leaf264]|uniref:LysR family transcriptional regulator n=1 Tax=Leifsonia sp. Leaf264 TaxID=1736314 RepID=UPI0006F1DE63|nr:LysR family transcriptional regulator [Leifsonia sp. Leaf264]KQO97575.1 LysR family transcriptional regulator [Leifsonia sp. Leaf264]
MPTSTSLARLDLNLLVSLDALLTERSVTRAAERLNLSQPALSASLARLRVHFNDQILARQGNSYQLTPLASRLAEQTGVALDAAQRVFSSQAAWDPTQSTREFTVYGSDYGFATVGRVVADLAADRAPHVRFRFMQHTPKIVEDALATLRSSDGLLLPHGFLSDLPYVDVSTDGWVIIASADNDSIGEAVSMDDITTAPWVFTYQSRSAFTSATRQLQQLGIEPNVECVVEGFLTLPSFIAGTRRLGLIQAHLADFARQNPRIRVLAPPFEATPITNALWWHPIHRRDPEHIWMRELFIEAGGVVDTASPRG